ncbi:penicillin acylase family protein [Candidatus Omnitrophota bacterium]
MKRAFIAGICIFLVLNAGAVMASISSETFQIKGLQEPVEVIIDTWGIAHIYAQNEHDLFFAQGFCAARDRLFQFEIWRRQATGTVSEILGPRELKRDIGTRLFMFRGDMQQEMNQYHPQGELIITSYVEGVNAYIDLTVRNPALLPLEFELLNIVPEKWTPEVVISRHQGLLMNVRNELAYGQAVHLLGSEKVKELIYFHPGEPDIDLDEAIDGSLLNNTILDLYNAFRRPVRFIPDDIIPSHRAARMSPEEQRRFTSAASLEMTLGECRDIGSNNWVLRGTRTQSRYPMMANDPHRTQAVPSLRYWVHLIAPGWDVIGGGEPEIPGISIGHNRYGAWGLTVFQTDGEDLYVYETNPDNPNQYRYLGSWEDMRIITDSINVKGQEVSVVDLKYTRHGPVVYEDPENNKAYAVRAAWLEIGGSPYLASLRMDQAHDWESFRDACSYSNIPGENMVWADREGNIGWQAVGIAPIRRNWSGLVPVPGDGRYEWDGYLPIKAKPHIHNPESGYWVTANDNLVPHGYPYRNTASWIWADPYRASRVREVIDSGRRHSMADMIQLQTDYLSIPARQLVPLLEEVTSKNKRTEQARKMLLDWNYKLDRNSIEAGIYVAWERRLAANSKALFIPDKAQKIITGIQMKKIIDWIVAPRVEFGEDPIAGRDAFLIRSLEEAVEELTGKLGRDMSKWRYGHPKYKHALIHHPLSKAVNEELRKKLNVGPLPRGGNIYTVGNTGRADNQTSGASFKIIVDTEDWDNSVGMNAPGQSGNPDNPHYRDLFELWARDKYFPVVYSRRKVESVAREVLNLRPGD